MQMSLTSQTAREGTYIHRKTGCMPQTTHDHDGSCRIVKEDCR